MSVDPRFERSVLAEFAVRERRAHRRDRSHRARAVAEQVAPRAARPVCAPTARRVCGSEKVPPGCVAIECLTRRRHACADRRRVDQGGGGRGRSPRVTQRIRRPTMSGNALETLSKAPGIGQVIWPGSSPGRRSRTASMGHALRGRPWPRFASFPTRGWRYERHRSTPRREEQQSEGAQHRRPDREPRRQAPPRQRLLSPTEEIALARQIEGGDLKAKETMIRSNLGLVHAVARTYRGSGVPYDDLVQEGTLGLVRAVERFDHRRGVKFSTYAVWWIRRSMLDAIASSNAIRIPAKANQQRAAIAERRRSSGESADGAFGRRDRKLH